MSTYEKLLNNIMSGRFDKNISFYDLRKLKAKPYQVKQIRNIILKYKLGGDNDYV